MEKIDFLRKKYPRFIYKKYNYKISNNNLEISFDFQIESGIFFKPKIVIENVKKSQIDRLGANSQKIFNNLVFHLGLIEIPSYWKTTCSPEIIIEAGYLNKKQIRWWKDLILKGMGQFFYENKINFKKKNFLKIFSKPKSDTNLTIVKNVSGNRFLVPIGGGRDSIVTLEKLKEKVRNSIDTFKKVNAETKKIKEKRREIGCFLVNPTKIMKDVVMVSGIKDLVVVWRKIDPVLLELNKKGFLNGHTPFTAVLSFFSVFCAILFNYQNIAFSNEKSSNEGNLRYLGRVINHQWSKSSEFEKKFRNYCQKYLAKKINYFSFLRKYSELEISKMFTKYPQYFPVFSSCNVVLAKKLKRRWCGNCAKCLFVYATLYPFLEKEEILKVFGQDVFENKKLLPMMKGLINPKIAKPFECVGSKRESKAAFKLSLNKAKKKGQIPYLLRQFDILKF